MRQKLKSGLVAALVGLASAASTYVFHEDISRQIHDVKVAEFQSSAPFVYAHLQQGHPELVYDESALVVQTAEGFVGVGNDAYVVQFVKAKAQDEAFSTLLIEQGVLEELIQQHPDEVVAQVPFGLMRDEVKVYYQKKLKEKGSAFVEKFDQVYQEVKHDVPLLFDYWFGEQ